MAGRPPVARIKEVLERGFTDLYDAFADMDGDRDGRVSLHDFHQALQGIDGSEDLTGDQIDAAFSKCKSDDNGLVVFKDFHAAFEGQARTANDAGEIASSIVPRAFEEVLMECKDAEGVQKFVAVPANISWTDLLLKLKSKYGRSVIFMYEADGHTYTVKDKGDLKQCWDSVEEAFLKTNPVTPSGHLVAFIINLDPSKLSATGRTGGFRTGGKSHLAPKRVNLGQAEDPGHTESKARRQAVSEQFEAKHQWIDDMLRKTGASSTEPSSMRKRGFDKLLKACSELDPGRQKTLSVENFEKALRKVDPNLTADQVGWYVKDAKATRGKASGEVLYEKYCELKKTGKSIKEAGGVGGETIRMFESQISQAIKERYKTLQAGFKKLDEDKDGFLHKKDFREGLENKLKVKLQQQILDEIFKRADTNDDEKLDYEEFLQHFRAVPDVVKLDPDGTVDSLSNIDLCKLIVQTHAGLGQVWDEMDSNSDGKLTYTEFHEGIQKAGITVTHQRMSLLLNDLTLDHRNLIDYRKFMQTVSKLSLSDLGGSGNENLDREEARVRDKIREHYRDAKEAFHAFNKNKDGRLSQDEFFKGIDGVFGKETVSQAVKNKLMQRADVDGDGYLAYHEFLGRFGVKPHMRQALVLQEKISFELQRKFPDSMQKGFDQMDFNKDQRLDLDDLKKGIRDILKIKCSEDEMSAFLDRLKTETGGALDFQQFLVRFGLTFKSEGRWEYTKEKKAEVVKEKEEIKIFRRNMKASKWFGRGGIKAVLLRASSLGSMRDKWVKLNSKCAQICQGKEVISVTEFQDAVRGSNGVEPNFSDVQWQLFREEFLVEEKKHHETGRDQSFVTSSGEILYGKLCDELMRQDRTFALLGLKEFSDALRDGLGMSELSSEDIQLLSGKQGDNPWWQRRSSSLDIDAFVAQFVQKEFKNELVLFDVLLVKNAWIDVKQTMDSLNTSASASKTMITKRDLDATFSRLEALGAVTAKEREAIVDKVQADNRFEREGPNVGQLDYMKNFFLFYIPREVELHNIVYPNWEDCAEKFARFATTGEEARLPYRQFRQLCRQFVFSRDVTAGQLETLIDVMDEDGDGDISLDEFKKRYARDEAKVMDAVRTNWHKIQERLDDAKKTHNGLKRLDRADFQSELLFCRQELLPDVTAEQIMALTASLGPEFVADKEVKWDVWLRKYAGDFYLIHHAFQPEGKQALNRIAPWDRVMTCLEILEKSRSIESSRVWRFLRSSGNVSDQETCPICRAKSCIWHTEFEAHDLVTWDEFGRVMQRAGIELDPRLLNKLLDDLDPLMHGFVHWRAFIQGRIPKLKTNDAGYRSWVLSEPKAGPYFLNGEADFNTRKVLVERWNSILIECEKERKSHIIVKELECTQTQKPEAQTREGVLDLASFETCLSKVLTHPMDTESSEYLVKESVKIATRAFAVTSGSTAPHVNKAIDFHAFCQHYSQGDFNTEKYMQRKWQTVYQALKNKEGQEDPGYATQRDAKAALESPELGLSTNMVHMLLHTYSDKRVAEKENLVEGDNAINYVNLCWRFAKHNIQSVISNRCLFLFRKARQMDKSRVKRIAKHELQAVLKHHDVGLSDVESEIMIRKYEEASMERDTSTDQRDRDTNMDYHFLLSGGWEEIPCNAKLYGAFIALEQNWQKIADKFRSSDALDDGMIHIDDFKKLVLELRLPFPLQLRASYAQQGLRAVEQVLANKEVIQQIAEDLGPDASGKLNFDDFMWKMSSEVLVEVLAPTAPLLLKTFGARVQDLKLQFLARKAAMRLTTNNIDGGKPMKHAPISSSELAAMENAFNCDALTVREMEDTVRQFLQSLGVYQETSTVSGDDFSTADSEENAGRKQEAGGDGRDALQDAEGTEARVSGMHVKILVERMRDDGGREQGSSTGDIVTVESMLKVLRDLSHNQIFAQDLELFHSSLCSMIQRTILVCADTWTEPDGSEHVDQVKELTGVVVHAKGALKEVGRVPMRRTHMQILLSQTDGSKMPPALRASPQLAAIARRRERDVYHSNPWKTFWLESARKIRTPAHTSPVGAHVDVAGTGAAAGDRRVDGRKEKSSSAVKDAGTSGLSVAQDKVRKALFQRFDNISAAFVALDHTKKGVISMPDFKKGLSDLQIGLSEDQIQLLLAAETGGDFITYQDFLDKYSTPLETLADIAARRESSGVYSRLRNDLAHLHSGQVGEAAEGRTRAGGLEEEADRHPDAGATRQ